MDGHARVAGAFTSTDGWFALGYYDQHDLPFYHWLASTFALADRYFPSVRSGTFPHRDYLLLGTSDQVQSTGTTVWPEAPARLQDHRRADRRARRRHAAERGVRRRPRGHRRRDPPADVQIGEAWTRRLYTVVAASPAWDSTALAVHL